MFAKTHRKYNTKSKPNINYGLWWIKKKKVKWDERRKYDKQFLKC